MQEYVNSEVSFTGELIGSSTTEKPEKDRWVEIYIFRTQGDRYIAEVYGMSDVAGEEDRETVHVAVSQEQLVESMRHRGRLSKPSQEALKMAGIQPHIK